MENGRAGGKWHPDPESIDLAASAVEHIPPEVLRGISANNGDADDEVVMDLLGDEDEYVGYEVAHDIDEDIVEDINIHRPPHVLEDDQRQNNVHTDSDSPNNVEKKVTPISSDSSLRHQKHYLNKSNRHLKGRPRTPNSTSNGESRIQIYTIDDRVHNNIQTAHVKVRELGAVDTEEPTICSIYITSCLNKDGNERHPIMASTLESEIVNLLVGKIKMHETSCGLVVEFTKEEDLDRVLKLKMAQVFGHAVIVWQFPIGLRRYRKVVTIKDIPWCVPIMEIQNALRCQGIKAGRVTRKAGTIRIEIKNASDLERLLQEGLSFFDCATFPVTLEVIQHGYDEPEIIQCYRCQRFWHTAAHCRYTPRCVRCGLNHDVSSCEKSRSSAKCCLCGGKHHAAHKMCPVRLQHINALQVELSLSKKQPVPSKSYYD